MLTPSARELWPFFVRFSAPCPAWIARGASAPLSAPRSRLCPVSCCRCIFDIYVQLGAAAVFPRRLSQLGSLRKFSLQSRVQLLQCALLRKTIERDRRSLRSPIARPDRRGRREADVAPGSPSWGCPPSLPRGAAGRRMGMKREDGGGTRVSVANPLLADGESDAEGESSYRATHAVPLLCIALLCLCDVLSFPLCVSRTCGCRPCAWAARARAIPRAHTVGLQRCER